MEEEVRCGGARGLGGSAARRAEREPIAGVEQASDSDDEEGESGMGVPADLGHAGAGAGVSGVRDGGGEGASRGGV